MKTPNSYENFAELKERLDEIVQGVSDESLPFEEMLSLYEEAVSLGTRAIELIEQAPESDSEEQSLGEDETADQESVSLQGAQMQTAASAGELATE